MAHRTIHFNQLPEVARERFAACTHGAGMPRPLLADARPTPRGIGPALLLLLVGAGGGAALWLVDFGQASEWGIQGPLQLALFGVAAAAVFYALLFALRRAAERRALPWVPGRYVFPMEEIDARTEQLTLYPMADAEDFETTHHEVGDDYSHSHLSFVFPHGSEVFELPSRELAEQRFQEVHDATEALGRAIAEEDAERLRELDVLFEARIADGWTELSEETPERPAGGPVARPLSWIYRLFGLIALLAGAATGFGVWSLRNDLSDLAAFEAARASNDVGRLERYLALGGKRSDEALDVHLPAAALARAEAHRNVAALREYLAGEYATREDLRQRARERIAGHYSSAVDRFLAQAPRQDPRMLSFVSELIRYLEQHGSPPLRVRFRTPPATELVALDERLQALAKQADDVEVAPVAPHFAPDTAAAREAAMVSRLAQGFAEVFPSDILDVQPGAPLTADKPEPQVAEPTVEVRYQVAAKTEEEGQVPKFYRRSTSRRHFVGIEVEFEVAVRIPGGSTPYGFSFTVEPPDRFTVATRPAGEPSAGPRDSLVYSIMADRAFDHLEKRLLRAFFGAAGD